MGRTKVKGFTILEMVIVIAVIAVLAGVMIPTFSGVMKKTRLSSDTQAVRNMNLAIETEESLHGPAKDIETVMSILEKAGYSESDWHVESEGYAVYWYKAENRLILYNDSEGKIAYPEELDPERIAATKAQELYVYNGNERKALEANIFLASRGGNMPVLQNYTDLQSKLNSPDVLAAMGWGSAEIKNADKQIVNGAVLEFASVNVDGAIGNAYRISQENSKDPKAQIAAGEMLYTLFAKINDGRITGPVAILLGEGSVLDVSSHEWISPKVFTGYFGTVDGERPATVCGARITENTRYADTLRFEADGCDYSFVGFFNTICGKTTVENVIFEAVQGASSSTIRLPATDHAVKSGYDNANCIGIIGAITDPGNDTGVDVLLKGITVNENVSLIGSAAVGGLVGYIGGFGAEGELKGKITVSGCKVGTNALSVYTTAYDSVNAAPVGGFIGMTERMAADATLTFGEGNAFTGTLNGHYDIGALIGRFSSGQLENEDTVALNGHYNTEYFTQASRVNPSIPKETGAGD